MTDMLLSVIQHAIDVIMTDTNGLSMQVSMSNWEARHLDCKQLQYAALDAILTGQVFRGLRLWHSAPSNCSTCHQPMGVMPSGPLYVCSHNGCNQAFASHNTLQSHAKKMRHSNSVLKCHECGRLARK